MSSPAGKSRHFRDLHRPGQPLLLPNPWDAGAAKILASLGFQALATTSSGFADTLDGVARTVHLAAQAGLAGCSIEDFSGTGLYDRAEAASRVAAAAAAARDGGLVLTARAENYLHGNPDLADTIARLQAYQEAGADVLYAPGLTRLEDIEALVSAVDRPVNVLAMPGVPPVAELAAAGVSRVSVGGAFAFAALSGLVDAATELRDEGTYGFQAHSAAGRRAAGAAFG
jgi:2-methylisocitrate lyase-like PEP mutase family enzyme